MANATTPVIQINEGKVGIGTTSPTSLLHLKKATGDPMINIEAVASGDPGITFTSINDRTGNIFYSDGTTNAMLRYDHADVSFKLYAHNTTVADFVLNETTAYFPSQNVGIGTTDPDEKLVLYRPINYAADSALYSAYAVNSTAVDNNKVFKWKTGITGNQGGHNLTFSTLARTESSYTERMRISVEGNVGINATAYLGFNGAGDPSHSVAYNAGIDGVQLRGQNGVIFGTGGGATAVERMRIDSSGLVGINVTSPQTRLQTNLGITGSYLGYLNGTASTFDMSANVAVVHNSPAIGNGTGAGLVLANNDKSNGAPSPIIAFSAKSASNSYNHTYAAIYGVRTATGADTNWTKGDIVLATGVGTGPNEIMRVTSAGNVGIGEVGPSSKLVVRKDNAGGRGGEISIVNYATNTVGNEAALNFGLESSTYHADFGNAQIKARVMAANAASDMIFSTWNGTSFGERMRIEAGGNVGIGVTVPLGKLHVALPSYTNEDTNSQQAIFGASNGYGVRIGYNETDNKGYINVLKPGVAWGSLILQEDVGNVGIGTTSPGATLDVDDGNSGKIRLLRDGSVRAEFTNAANEGEMGLYRSNNVKTIYISSYYDSYFNGGNVGIGTTTNINAPLTVQADGSAGAINLIGRVNGIYDESIISFYDNNGTTRKGYILNSGGNMFFSTGNASENMTILSGGNVGIGETSPDQKLNVREDGGSDVFRGIEVHNSSQSGARAGICFKAYDWVQSAIWHGRTGTAAYGGALVLGTNPNTTDLTVSGVTGRMYILNNGNVGIGDNTPDYRLAVKKVNAATPAIMVSGAHYGGPRIQTYGLDADANAWMGLGTDMSGAAYEHSIYFSDYNGNGRLTMGTYNGTTYSTKMTILRDGSVGIGATPTYPFDVHKASNSGVIMRVKGIGAQLLIESNTAGEAYLYQKPNVTGDKEARFMMTGGTTYGWAWTDDAVPASRTKFMKLDQNPGTLTVKGDVIAYGTPSDISLKENIKPIDSALDKAMKLQGVTFDWKKTDSILELKEDIGFIAQDVQKVVPELVRKNSNGLLSMRHQGIAPILLEAIKELKAEIDLLKSKPCTCNKCNCNI